MRVSKRGLALPTEGEGRELDDDLDKLFTNQAYDFPCQNKFGVSITKRLVEPRWIVPAAAGATVPKVWTEYQVFGIRQCH